MEGIHTSAKMMKEATGVALTAAVRGVSRMRTLRYLAASTARRMPVVKASTPPPTMRTKEKPTAPQKAGRPTNSSRTDITLSGDGKSSSCPSHMLAACHTKIQKSAAITGMSRTVLTGGSLEPSVLFLVVN